MRSNFSNDEVEFGTAATILGSKLNLKVTLIRPQSTAIYRSMGFISSAYIFTENGSCLGVVKQHMPWPMKVTAKTHSPVRCSCRGQRRRFCFVTLVLLSGRGGQKHSFFQISKFYYSHVFLESINSCSEFFQFSEI